MTNPKNDSIVVEDEVIQPIKVAVTLFNGETIWGYAYLRDNQRLQDLMNDPRPFIPIEEESGIDYRKDDYRSTIISKKAIVKVREVIDFREKPPIKRNPDL